MSDDLRTSVPGWAGRWGRAAAVVLVAGVAASLAACTGAGASDFTPKPIVTITPSAPPKPSPSTPIATPTPTPTPTATATPEVKATGSMSVFMPVSDALTGTCRTMDAGPTITLVDANNDFFTKVDATVVLNVDRSAVASIEVTFRKDTEGFTWHLAHPAAGTSAKLVASKNTYTLSGKLKAVETRKAKTIEEIVPFSLVAKCASADW